MLVAARLALPAREAPAGIVTLTFSGDASIQLKVECLEAELQDLGPGLDPQSSKPEASGR